MKQNKKKKWGRNNIYTRQVSDRENETKRNGTRKKDCHTWAICNCDSVIRGCAVHVTGKKISTRIGCNHKSGATVMPSVNILNRRTGGERMGEKRMNKSVEQAYLTMVAKKRQKPLSWTESVVAMAMAMVMMVGDTIHITQTVGTFVACHSGYINCSIVSTYFHLYFLTIRAAPNANSTQNMRACVCANVLSGFEKR